MEEQKKPNKKNPDLARLLGGDISQIEKKITGTDVPSNTSPETPKPEQPKAPEPERSAKRSTEQTPVAQENEEESQELIYIGQDDLDLPRSFTKVFKKNQAFEKYRRTSALLYQPVLEEYKKVASAMGVDTVVLMNNVLIEWFNKNIEVCEKVVERKSKVKAF